MVRDSIARIIFHGQNAYPKRSVKEPIEKALRTPSIYESRIAPIPRKTPSVLAAFSSR
jgi:hypothetical protein